MGRLQYIPSFYFSKFAQLVSGPYTAFDAYRAGNIDENGNIIGNESNIDPFEYFVLKLKQIFGQLPPGMTRYKLENIIGTMQIFSEEANSYGITKDEFDMLVESEFMLRTDGYISYLELLEDMGTSSVAGGLGTPASAPGANQGNVSGYDPVMGSMQTRSGPVNMISAVDIFSIPSAEFKMIKKTKSYPPTVNGKYLKRYGQRNSGKKIAIKDEESGEVHWLPAPTRRLSEDFFLNESNPFLTYLINEQLKQGQKNLTKVANAQYSAITNFLNNHVKNIHGVDDTEDIEISFNNGTPAIVKFKDFSNNIRSSIDSIHTIGTTPSNESGALFSIKTRKGTFQASVPHISAHGTPDLTIDDPHASDSQIKIDTKAARGRWQQDSAKFQDDNLKPTKIPTSEFDAGKSDKNSFVVIHDDDGNITYVDHSNMRNIKKLISKVYVKSGSTTRPGKFAMIGEIGMRLAKRGIKKAYKKGMHLSQKKDNEEVEQVLDKSSQKNFARAIGELTNTTFGVNDLYTSLLRKQ